MLAGTLSLWVEGEEKRLGQGELARVGPEVRRQLANRGEEDVLLLALGGRASTSAATARPSSPGTRNKARRRRRSPCPPTSDDRAHGADHEAQYQEIEAGEDDPFGIDDEDIEWIKKTHQTLLRREDGTLIGKVGLVFVDVEAGREAFQVAGVGGVIVTHSERGKGHLRPLLEAALERAAELGAGARDALLRRAQRAGLRPLRLRGHRGAGHRRSSPRPVGDADARDVAAPAGGRDVAGRPRQPAGTAVLTRSPLPLIWRWYELGRWIASRLRGA